jgi:hypothetical protein
MERYLGRKKLGAYSRFIRFDLSRGPLVRDIQVFLNIIKHIDNKYMRFVQLVPISLLLSFFSFLSCWVHQIIRLKKYPIKYIKLEWQLATISCQIVWNGATIVLLCCSTKKVEQNSSCFTTSIIIHHSGNSTL